MSNPTPHPGLTPDLRQRLAAAVARKAWELNQKLTQLLASQDVDLSTLGLGGGTGTRQSKIEKLRRYFDSVVAAQKRSHTDAFGMCLDCDEPIPVAALTEIPWRLRCAACEERARRDG